MSEQINGEDKTAGTNYCFKPGENSTFGGPDFNKIVACPFRVRGHDGKYHCSASLIQLPGGKPYIYMGCRIAGQGASW